MDGWLQGCMDDNFTRRKKKGFENLWKSWFPIQEPHLIHFYTWTFSWWLLFFDHFVEVLCYLYLCNVFLEMLQCLKKVTLQLDLHFRNRTRSQQGKYDKYSRLEIKFVLVQGKKPEFSARSVLAQDGSLAHITRVVNSEWQNAPGFSLRLKLCFPAWKGWTFQLSTAWS